LNGVTGRYFGDGANKLFLPAAGSRWSTKGEINEAGSDGYYWGSTVDNFYAYLLHFKNDHDIHLGRSYRAGGFSVRCVAEP
jgi:hypothetical protein